MAVLTTIHKKTTIKCMNMSNTNNTLVVAPNFKGNNYVSLIIRGVQIAKEIISDDELIKVVYNDISKKHNLYRKLVSA